MMHEPIVQVRVPYDATVVSVCYETDEFKIDLRNGTERIFTAAELSAHLKFAAVVSDICSGTTLKLYWKGRVTEICHKQGKEPCKVQLEDGTKIELRMEEAHRHAIDEETEDAAVHMYDDTCALCYSEFGSTVSHTLMRVAL